MYVGGIGNPVLDFVGISYTKRENIPRNSLPHITH
jgi:hypothetical protein